MFSPKWINPNCILVRIDREKQRKKREFLNEFLVASGNTHMTRNQQAGEVLMVGRHIQALIPGAQKGDTALFHHSVEGSVLADSEKIRLRKNGLDKIQSTHLLHEDDTWNYYIVRQDLLYACMKPDGKIITHPDIVFAIPAATEEDNRELKAVPFLNEKTGKMEKMYVFKNFKEEREVIEKRLAEMKREAETHKERAAILMAQMERLTASLNKRRVGIFMPVFVPDRMHRDFGREIDSTYGIYYEFLGSKETVPRITQIEVASGENTVVFYVLRYNYVLCAKKLSMFKDDEETITLHEVTTTWEQEQAKMRATLPEAARKEGTSNIIIVNKKSLF